jgi:NADH-quinone oxidoreductase subunit L|tara:strand:+ start:13860 stop:15761 length:1902 start_codon:yes stop_codon:yes gene_type:complete
MKYLFLVPIFIPFLTSIFLFINKKLFKNQITNFFTLNGSLLSFLVSGFVFFDLATNKFKDYSIKLFQWTNTPDISIGFTVDGLSATMLLLVTGLSLVIQVFSTSYMKDDEKYTSYFTYFNFFVFSMLLLVMSSNFLVMFMGWELVGLSSYLLISFWSNKESASKAGNKAFIINRIGDFGFLIGLMIVLNTFETFDFKTVMSLSSTISESTVTIICLFLLLGAFGKSAQFPLFSWLPDAMEGPTPASALIHAATMVTAGVFMLVRVSPLLQHSETAKLLIAIFGLLTALIAAFSAINQYDIKKVLAYSTISQLGFMFIAIGSGAYVAAIFHLVTHAFFKALLFLGAGAVIHAMHHEQDIRKMGMLRKNMPVTALTMGIGTLAISGLPPLAGFWSKDEILASVFVNGGVYYVIWSLGLFAALLTAFYMGRHWLLIFAVDQGNNHDDVKEVSKSMTIPLLLLGLFSIFIGFINTPFFHGLEKVLHYTLENVYVTHLPKGVTLVVLAFVSIGAGFTGLTLAYLVFSFKVLDRINLDSKLFNTVIALVKDLSTNVLYLNKYGNLIFVKGSRVFSRNIAAVIDGIVIDGAVNSVASIFNKTSKVASTTQTGQVRSYIAYFGLFLVLLIALFIVTPLVNA